MILRKVNSAIIRVYLTKQDPRIDGISPTKAEERFPFNGKEEYNLFYLGSSNKSSTKEKIDIEIISRPSRKQVSKINSNPVVTIRPISNQSKLHFKALKFELDTKKVGDHQIHQKSSERNLSAKNNYYLKIAEIKKLV